MYWEDDWACVMIKNYVLLSRWDNALCFLLYMIVTAQILLAKYWHAEKLPNTAEYENKLYVIAYKSVFK